MYALIINDLLLRFPRKVWFVCIIDLYEIRQICPIARFYFLNIHELANMIYSPVV